MGISKIIIFGGGGGKSSCEMTQFWWKTRQFLKCVEFLSSSQHRNLEVQAAKHLHSLFEVLLSLFEVLLSLADFPHSLPKLLHKGDLIVVSNAIAASMMRKWFKHKTNPTPHYWIQPYLISLLDLSVSFCCPCTNQYVRHTYRLSKWQGKYCHNALAVKHSLNTK